MPEQQAEIPKINLGEKKLSRRNFLKLVGLGIGAGVVGGISLNNLITHPKYNSLNEEGTADHFSEHVGKMFGVKLSKEPSLDPSVGWDNGRSLMLGEFLSHLPNHFYSPHNEHLLEIQLTKNPEEGGKGYGGTYESNADIVTLRSGVFTPELKNVSFDICRKMSTFLLIHELTHRVNDIKEGVPAEKIKSIINDDFDNYIKGVETKSSDELYKLMLTRKKGDPEYEEVKLLNGILSSGLTSAIELLPALSEIYTQGKETFSKLGNWMEAEKVSKFYDVIKTDIFEGREYKNHDEVMGNFTLDPATGKIISAGFLK